MTKCRRYFMSGVGACCGMAVVVAQAQTIWIGYGPEGSITTFASSILTPGLASGSIMVDGVFFSVTALDLTHLDLGSSSTSVSVTNARNGPATSVNVWVSETDLSLPTAGDYYNVNFKSSFTQNSLPDGATVDQRTFVSEGATPYATSIPLGEQQFTASSTPSGPPPTYATAVLNNEYTLTQLYTITIPEVDFGKVVLSTIDLQTQSQTPRPPVPEIPTWAMMLAGFASLGYAGLRRVKKDRAPATA